VVTTACTVVLILAQSTLLAHLDSKITRLFNLIPRENLVHKVSRPNKFCEDLVDVVIRKDVGEVWLASDHIRIIARIGDGATTKSAC